MRGHCCERQEWNWIRTSCNRRSGVFYLLMSFAVQRSALLSVQFLFCTLLSRFVGLLLRVCEHALVAIFRSCGLGDFLLVLCPIPRLLSCFSLDPFHSSDWSRVGVLTSRYVWLMIVRKKHHTLSSALLCFSSATPHALQRTQHAAQFLPLFLPRFQLWTPLEEEQKREVGR